MLPLISAIISQRILKVHLARAKLLNLCQKTSMSQSGLKMQSSFQTNEFLLLEESIEVSVKLKTHLSASQCYACFRLFILSNFNEMDKNHFKYLITAPKYDRYFERTVDR